MLEFETNEEKDILRRHLFDFLNKSFILDFLWERDKYQYPRKHHDRPYYLDKFIEIFKNEGVLKILKEILHSKFTLKDVLRALSREYKLMLNNKNGGRKNKIWRYTELIKNTKTKEEKTNWLKDASYNLSRTSFYRLRKKLGLISKVS